MTSSYATVQNYIDIAPSTKVSISVGLPPTRAHILISLGFSLFSFTIPDAKVEDGSC